MSISLKDVVKPTFGFQGTLQGAGTLNQGRMSLISANPKENIDQILRMAAHCLNTKLGH